VAVLFFIAVPAGGNGSPKVRLINLHDGYSATIDTAEDRIS
jgi:hypothetical protein